MKTFYVIALSLDDGMLQPLAWTTRRLSLRELRRVTKKFRRDPDVIRPCSVSWPRLYRSPKEMARELPRYG